MNMTASETEKRVLRNSHVSSFRRSTNSRPYISLHASINKSYNSPAATKLTEKPHLCLPHSTSGQHLGTVHDPLDVPKTVSFYQVSFYFIHNKTPNNLWKSSHVTKGYVCLLRYYDKVHTGTLTRSGSNSRSSTRKPMLFRLAIP